MNRIQDLPISERPREKLTRNGAVTLTNTELLAVILGSGTRKQDVMSISSMIFPSYTKVFSLMHISPKNLSQSLQIPLLHSIKLVAIFTLLERLLNTEEQFINTPVDIYRQFNHFASLHKEHLIGVYINSRNRKVHDEVISIGSTTENLFPINEIISPALVYHTTSIVVIHNHPSGDTTPSDADIVLTRRLKKACQLFSITLLDHIIISSKGFHSFSEHNQI